MTAMTWRSSGAALSFRHAAWLLATTALTAPLMILPAAAQSLPTGGSVAAGSVAIAQPSATQMTITQSSQSAVVNWQGFSVGQGSAVNIAQPNASAALLNRVTGDTPSTIAGSLTANGQVYLVNPNGIAITPSGTVDVGGGFAASTLDIPDADFMAGRRTFRGTGASAGVSNAGTIRVGRGGYAALIGGTVDNSGTIEVPLGKVGLGSGEQATLDFSGDGFLQVAVPTQADNGKALVTHSGRIRADGGSVVISAATAREAARNAVNLSGHVQARSISGRSGSITIGGGAGGKVAVSGKLNVASRRGKGGKVTVTGRDIALQGAIINASGKTGGGDVRIGGDWQGRGSLQRADTTSVDAATAIKADTRDSGDGGSVVVWSDLLTSFAGQISAKGGALGGNGGNAEVSGMAVLAYTGSADLSASKGKFGTLLLDPYNITISDAPNSGSGLVSGVMAPNQTSNINIATLTAALATANVRLSTGDAASPGGDAGNITLSSALSWNSSATLTLQAANNISLNAPVTAAAGGLTLDAGNTITATGDVALARFTLQRGNWVQNNATLPAFTAADFRLATNDATFLRATGGAGTDADPYTLTDIYGVQGIGTMRTQSYRLAADIDASWTAAWNDGAGFAPIGNTLIPFSGSFDGAGHVISSLTIDRPSTDYVGLFGEARNAAIRDVGLANVDVAGGDFVGGLVGYNQAYDGNSSISGSHVSGAVSGTQTVGGLVGYNTAANGGSASISGSYASVEVTGGGPGYYIGGLVGVSMAASGGHTSISQSYATGSVNGSSYVGGLVGYNFSFAVEANTNASISQSYATGAVNGTSYVGGLVGYNAASASSGSSASASITQSYATGAVTGNDQVGGLVGYNAASASQSGDSANTIVYQTYATGRVTGGGTTVAGLVGYNYQFVESGGAATASVGSSFWDVVTTGRGGSGVGSNNGGTVTNVVGLTTAQFFDRSSFVGWTFGTAPATSGWVMVNASGTLNGTSGATRPMLLSEWSTDIVNTHQLQLMALDRAANYTLRADLDFALEMAAGPSGLWRVAANAVPTTEGMAYGFVPVGNGSVDFINPFTGSFDGAGHTIFNLTIQRPNSVDVGLFGRAQNATIRDVRLADVDVLGMQRVGGLVGYNLANGGDASISGSHVSGVVSGAQFVGGLVGYNQATGLNSTASISGSHASATVNGGVGGNGYNVGGLVGANGAADGGHASIDRSYATGAVNGSVGRTSYNVGGLVGQHSAVAYDGASVNANASISQSYASGAVNGSVGGTSYNVGGLVGYNEAYAYDGASADVSIDRSYATGAATGNDYVGGLVGQNSAVAYDGASADVNIDRSYATGAATGNSYVGGLVGWNYAYASGAGASANASIDQIYASGWVTGSGPYIGGLVGWNNRQVSSGGAATASVGSSFWDIDTTGRPGGVGSNNSSVTNVVGLTGHVAPYTQSTYTNNGWDFSSTGVWFMVDGATRPFLRSEWSTEIANAHQLQLMSMKPGDAYTLAGDIDLAPALSDPAGMWRTSTRADGLGQYGFAPVGDDSAPFIGSLDGAGHVISNLKIYRPNANDVGLLGYAQNADIRNVGLTGVDVRGGFFVGGLVGYNEASGGNASISQSYSSGQVVGYDYVGGLVGYNYASISGSHAAGIVSASSASADVGGLVGVNATTASISRSYAAVAVSGFSNATGGLVGRNQGSIDQSYATGTVTASTTVGGLVGWNYGSISQSYATGAVGGTQFVGGLVGRNEDNASITQTYAVGAVNGTTAVGGLIGQLAGGSVSQSYWDTDTTGRAINEGVGSITGGAFNATGLTTAAMQDLDTFRTTYAGWDFAGVWSPPNQVGQNNGSATAYYPELYALSSIAAVDPTGSRHYGDPNANAPMRYYGVHGGDFVTTLATVSGGPGQYDPAGTHVAVTASGAAITSPAGNAYRYVYIPGEITVTQRPVTIAAAGAVQGSRVYNGTTDIAVLTDGTLSGVIGGDAVALALTASYDDKNAGTGKTVTGTYALTGAGAGNYVLALSSFGTTADITAATLTVTATAAGKTYGDTDPSLGYVVSGLQNGDAEAAVLSGGLTRSAGEDVGSYAIGQGGLAANANYTLVYNGGIFTIDRRPIIVMADPQSRIYGDANPLLTWTVGGMGLVDGDALSGALATEAITTSAPGAYPITQGTLAASANYDLTYQGALLTVLPQSGTGPHPAIDAFLWASRVSIADLHSVTLPSDARPVLGAPAVITTLGTGVFYADPRFEKVFVCFGSWPDRVCVAVGQQKQISLSDASR